MKLNTLLVFLSLSFLVSAPSLAADSPAFKEIQADSTLIKHLRAGGYVLYMRHGTSDASRPDRAPSVDLADCSTQRPLTPEGRVLAAAVGASIRKAKIPVGDIYSSPLCRAKESAEAAFGRNFVINPLLMYTSNLTDEEKVPIVAETRRLLSAPVKAGTNRVLVAHAPNMMDVIGLFPKPEGSVIVIRPLGNNTFEYVASITPDAWAGLTQAGK